MTNEKIAFIGHLDIGDWSFPSSLAIRDQLFDVIHRDRDAFEDPFHDDVFAHDALKPANYHSPAADLVERAHHDQAVARHDGIAESHVLQSAKADHFRPQQVVLLRDVAA